MQQLLHASMQYAIVCYVKMLAIYIGVVQSCTCSSMCTQDASQIEYSCLPAVGATYDQVRCDAHDRIYWQRKVDAGAAAGAQPCEGGHVDADQPCAAV